MTDRRIPERQIGLGWHLTLAGLVGILIVAAVANRSVAPAPLTEVYTPTYARAPFGEPARTTARHLWTDLHGSPGLQFLRRIVPGESGALWLSLVVLLTIGIDFDRIGSPLNLDLVALQGVGFCLFQIMRFFRLLRDPTYVHLMDWVFSAVFALSVFLMARALWRIFRPRLPEWRPALGLRPIAALAILLVVCDVAIALVREPDDAGFFINLGAQRLRERHRLPYGDPLLDGSAGAAYGPLLYFAHLPIQLVLSPKPINSDSPDRPALGAGSRYDLPPPLATKLCTIAFHLVGLYALFAIGRRVGTERTGWALVALYAGSIYVLGVGGDEYFIGGMTYVSHIAPPAAVLVAFAALSYPAAAGALLAVAAGVGLYPAFLAPAWLGYYWNKRVDRRRFAAGLIAAGAVIAALVLALSRPMEGRTLVGTILFDTLGHHTDPAHYGNSPFSFWGQRSGARGWMMRPLLASSGLTTPMFLFFLMLSVAGFWMAKRRSVAQLALLTAAVTIGATLLKIHPTGTYVAWYYPFFLVGLFADLQPSETAAPAGRARAHSDWAMEI